MNGSGAQDLESTAGSLVRLVRVADPAAVLRQSVCVRNGGRSGGAQDLLRACGTGPVAARADSACAFAPAPVPGKWLADLPMLARQRLETVGVHDVHGAPRCTVDNADDFYSWRRDGPCGRMATLVWIRPR